MKKIFSTAAVLAALSAQPLLANICDNRPSAWIGTGGTVAVAAGGGATAGIVGTASAAGLYTIPHAITGATMLGSTAGGASAAGTVGIMGGTAGAGAAVIGFVLNPLVWVPAVAVAAGAVVYEGGCYLLD
jgi:hypothetical protein